MHCTLVIYPAERKRDAILIASIIGNARAMDVARCGEVDATRYTHIISLTPQPLPWAAEEFISEAEDAAQAGERLRYRFERADGKVMPPDLLKERMESFLREHNTCALATCRKGKPRSTPMEYHYLDGCLFLLSSGGLKFIGFSETEAGAFHLGTVRALQAACRLPGGRGVGRTSAGGPSVLKIARARPGGPGGVCPQSCGHPHPAVPYPAE